MIQLYPHKMIHLTFIRNVIFELNPIETLSNDSAFYQFYRRGLWSEVFITPWL